MTTMSNIDMKERLRPFGISFEKSLDDLIKGIRAVNSDSEKLSAFFDKSIEECKKELKTSDLELKSTAILKLAYLEMYGFDMSWCSFNILEVMSSPKFQHKRIGYLAATQILQRQNNEDALMLMTNLLKKDLNSVHFIETSLAISGIAAVVSKELALDICDDMAKLLSHSRPLIRKKAILAMYKIFLKYPESLRNYYQRIVDKLDDPDSSVVSATVNVICELAHANPSNYIDLAPRLYAMLQESNNNWMVIRLLKLFTSLSLTEPRLKNRLLPEIKTLMISTKALSVVYECINLILKGKMLDAEDFETAQLIVDKLLIFFESDDQNLKYVGLLAFIKTCKINQNLIKQHDKIILTSIYDNDATIRETSLEIVNSLVSEKNIMAIVTRLTVQLLPFTEQQKQLDRISQKLLSLQARRNNASEDDDDDDEGDEDEADEAFEHLSEYTIGSLQQPIVVSDRYKYILINKIIEICSINNYENIPNFRWYLGVLTDILKLNRDNKVSDVDRIVSEQLVDVGLRVPGIRPQLVELCLQLCGIPAKPEEEILVFKNGLSNCMWIIGEYYDEYMNYNDSDIEDGEDYDECYRYSAIEIIECLSHQKMLERLGRSNFDKTITIYIHSIAKLFSKFCSIYGEGYWSLDQFEAVKLLAIKTINWISKFQNSVNFETQERALVFIEVLRLVEESIESQIESIKLESNENEFGGALPPMFLTKGYNKFFSISSMQPMSKKFQQKVQIPLDLDLNENFDEQAIFNFQNSYNRLQMEDMDIDTIDYYEKEDIEDNDDVENIEEDVSFSQPGSKSENKKANKNHPYYINSDESNDSAINNDTKNELPSSKQKEDSKKKPKKPKKYKKEKVIALDDDFSGKDFETDTMMMASKPSQFLIDDSALANIDLKQNTEQLTPITDEYQIEEDEVQSARPEIKYDDKIIEAPTKRKPKKKAKKKVAIIE